MKRLLVLAAAGAALFSTVCGAQRPTPEMINTVLPEEGAPKAEPGRYTTTSEPVTGVAGLKLFRPADLGRFPRRDKLPVVVWGNGGCAIDSPRFSGFLETIASHGFLVITTRAETPAAPAAPGTPPPRQATADDLKPALDWVERENARTGSPLFRKIDTAHIAAMGQSCGGMLAITLGADPRVDTTVVFNAGLNRELNPGQMDAAGKLHGPVLLINGHERDFMMGPSKATFDAINDQPVFYGARRGGGHLATMFHPGGGEFANVAANWVRWQFKNDRKAGAMFAGSKCQLCRDPNWEVAAKRLRN